MVEIMPKDKNFVSLGRFGDLEIEIFAAASTDALKNTILDYFSSNPSYVLQYITYSVAFDTQSPYGAAVTAFLVSTKF